MCAARPLDAEFLQLLEDQKEPVVDRCLRRSFSDSSDASSESSSFTQKRVPRMPRFHHGPEELMCVMPMPRKRRRLNLSWSDAPSPTSASSDRAESPQPRRHLRILSLDEERLAQQFGEWVVLQELATPTMIGDALD